MKQVRRYLVTIIKSPFWLFSCLLRGRNLFICSLIFIALIAGLSFAYWELYPWQVFKKNLDDVKAFTEGGEAEADSWAFQKLIADNGGFPYRDVIKDVYRYPLEKNATVFDYTENGLAIRGFYKNPPPGYVLMSGTFPFTSGEMKHGYLLMDTKGKLVRYWYRAGDMMGAVDPKRGYLLVGGSIRHWCSDPDVEVGIRMPATFHTIEVAPDGTYWTGDNFVLRQYDPEIRTSDGNYWVKRTISLDEIIQENTNISPLLTRVVMNFNVRKEDPNHLYPKIYPLADTYHQNDVEPFVDPRFKTNIGYALLVSVRNQNLVFVLDPVSHKILWYAQGVSEMQHDPDYFDGNIYIYDNGPHRGYARIGRLSMDKNKNPAEDYKIVLDGRRFDWIHPIRGNHSVLRNNNMMYHLITNERNASVLMFDEKQNPVFVLQNLIPGNEEHGLQIKSSLYISPQTFNELESHCKGFNSRLTVDELEKDKPVRKVKTKYVHKRVLRAIN